MFVTVADRSRRLYVARFSVRFSAVGGETFCARASTHVVGYATVSRSEDGEKPGKPHARRMHRLGSVSWWGSTSTDGARITPLFPDPLLLPTAQRLAPRRCTLALEGSAPITRAALRLVSLALLLLPSRTRRLDVFVCL